LTTPIYRPRPEQKVSIINDVSPYFRVANNIPTERHSIL
jgi:hypothetical protein